MSDEETYEQLMESMGITGEDSKGKLVVLAIDHNVSPIHLVNAMRNLEVVICEELKSVETFCSPASKMLAFDIPDDVGVKYEYLDNSPTRSQRAEWRRSTMKIRK